MRKGEEFAFSNIVCPSGEEEMKRTHKFHDGGRSWDFPVKNRLAEDEWKILGVSSNAAMSSLQN